MIPRRPGPAFLAFAALLALAAPAAAAAELRQPRIAVLIPDGPDSPFWQPFDRFLRKAAQDLGAAVEIAYASGEAGENRRQLDAVLVRQPRPDYVLFKPFKRNGRIFLDLLEKSGIYSMTVNSALPEPDRAPAGRPRSRYRSWIGAMAPDDERAGHDLAVALAAKARAAGLKDDKGHICMIGLGGPEGDAAADERQRGLERAAAAMPDVELKRVPRIANWSAGLAADRSNELLARYPGAAVLWTAADVFALAASIDMELAGKIPGKTLFIGGMDALEPGLTGLIEGSMDVSLGGHVLEGAWALVLLVDHFNGIDFAAEAVTWATPMAPVERPQALAALQRLRQTSADRIDFRRFSKAHNPGLKAYDFNLLPASASAPASPSTR